MGQFSVKIPRLKGQFSTVFNTKPFSAIIVHSMSRFFRDQFQSEFYIRKLRRAGVEVVSITQQFDSDPTGNMVRQIIGTFDEYQSRENAKHTLRAMRENAKQDFWNGSIAPFGYQAMEVERRGTKVKKRLVVLEEEAAIVRQIYDWALGRSGPVHGVKAIVNKLNGNGVAMRGKPFHISNVHRILTSTTYAGEHVFNRICAKTREPKPQSEWVTSIVPAIMTREDYDIVQTGLAARSPKNASPRVVSGPTLLIGLAKCGTCGSGMTLRTGKSGRYRYYACGGCAQKGPTVCKGRAMPMATLDGMVTEHLVDKLFTPDRLKIVLEAYIARSSEAQTARQQRLATAKQRQTEISGKITRLLNLVANGLMEQSDSDLLSSLSKLKILRAAAVEEIELLENSSGTSSQRITPEKVEKLGQLLRHTMTNPDPVFRNTYIRLFVESVVVGDNEIRISGPKAALAKTAAGGTLPPAAAMVPSFVREWRPRRDSNPRPQD